MGIRFVEYCSNCTCEYCIEKRLRQLNYEQLLKKCIDLQQQVNSYED